MALSKPDTRFTRELIGWVHGVIDGSGGGLTNVEYDLQGVVASAHLLQAALASVGGDGAPAETGRAGPEHVRFSQSPGDYQANWSRSSGSSSGYSL